MTGWMFQELPDGSVSRAAQVVFTAAARLIALSPIGKAHTRARRVRWVGRPVRYRKGSAITSVGPVAVFTSRSSS